LPDSPFQSCFWSSPLVSQATPRRLLCRCHEAEIANPRVPPVVAKSWPGIVEGGIAHAGCVTGSAKCMLQVRSMVAWTHCPASRLGRVTKTHEQRTYLVAVLSGLVNAGESRMPQPSSTLIEFNSDRLAQTGDATPHRYWAMCKWAVRDTYPVTLDNRSSRIGVVQARVWSDC
jgi:hypothetical protein